MSNWLGITAAQNASLQRLSIISSFCFLFALSVPHSLYAQFSPGSVYLGTNDYVEYHAGDLPIIISVPHGGYLEPLTIPDRVCSGCVTGRDSRTEETAYDLKAAIRSVFGGNPHIIINKLARRKLDANREIVEAALGNPEAETAWYEYHDFIQAAKDSCKAQFGSALFIDLHGHGHPIQRIELGYLLNRSRLQDSDSTLDVDNRQDDSAIKHLANVLNPSVSFAEILRGSKCMGEFLLERGYPSVPSASDPAPLPADPFFAGGYNTVRHGSRDSSEINAIQFELNWTGVRSTDLNRKAFARALACAMRSYLDQWYFDLDSWDPGNLVSTTADAGPGSLRSVLLGAEDGSTISFAPALQGDTIRLNSELQICANLIIEGPGADLLAISGEDSTRILRIMPGNEVSISGLSFARGREPVGDGGAVYVDGSLRLSNCDFNHNFAAEDGGAIALADSSAIVELDSCRLSQNSCGDDGGALRCTGGMLIIKASSIRNNFSPSLGGALSSDGIVKISHSSILDNEALSSGGGIRMFGGGSLSCINSTIAGNLSQYRGGGISSSASVSLDFCSLLNNTAISLGGGIRVPIGGICRIKNSLVAGNNASNGDDVSMFAGAFVSDGFNLIGDTTSSAWVPGPNDQLGNTAAPLDPLVLPLGDYGGLTKTIALQSTSPCIDQADAVGAPILDQRGELRLSGSSTDIGAYEYCLATSAIDVQTACDSFIWLDGITYFTDNNTATYTLHNAAGCDSVLTLNLNLTQLDTSLSQTANVLSANLAGATYQWLDCNNGWSALAGETNQSFSPSSNGSYAVEITQNGCVDTSRCFAITRVGLLENDFGDQFALYPNPSEGVFFIELGGTYAEIKLKVYNASGQVVQESAFYDAQRLSLRLEGPAAYYFVEVLADETKRATIKLLKR
ncbi:MAG: T9SS type A sorting domain-containing protein [Bacteroidota bacterium]